MVRRRNIGLIAIFIAVCALIGASVADAKSRTPRPPRQCRPGKPCRHGTGICNDAGRCCNTAEGDVPCGGNCCEPGIQACCDGSTCANLLEDNSNCGGCGNVCTGGKTCQNGVCACPNGGTECAGVCTNVLFDDANCGACGTQCDTDEKCFLGSCGCKDPTKLYCDRKCVDGFVDPNNCGQCGNVCPAGQECAGGSCQPPCGPCEERVGQTCVPKEGEGNCNGACVDLQNDPNNCGSCGNVCPNSGSCQDGECNPCPSSTGLDYTWCPADLGGDIIGVCCRPETPQCCFTTTHGGSCCGANETCCDGYCCGAGTHCCPNSRHTYACIPDGQPCPD